MNRIANARLNSKVKIGRQARRLGLDHGESRPDPGQEWQNQQAASATHDQIAKRQAARRIASAGAQELRDDIARLGAQHQGQRDIRHHDLGRRQDMANRTTAMLE